MHNIIWFRSDLRTLDNPALNAALTSKSQNMVRAVFVLTLKQWQQHDWGANKIGFVLQSVIALQIELLKLNIALDIIDCADFLSLPKVLAKYLRDQQASALFYNAEYELNEAIRDAAVTKLVGDLGVSVHEFHGQALIRPCAILSKQQTPYTIFTPFKKACYNYLFDHPVKLAPKPKPQLLSSAYKLKSNQIPVEYKSYLENPILKLWPAGQQQALQRLNSFCDSAITNYQQARDFPNLDGTSGLSPYLAIGAISVAQCFVAAINVNQQEFASGNANISCWISELIWRDFYKHIIYHFPNLCKGKNFNRKYDNLNWQKPGQDLQLWQQGQTGVPIIDAAMRQLIATGWMHNRLRMVVAMFLTKNLLIDWRHGEKFFSKHLIDLDFASNNGGWQWSASTGTDAVPYFRIFNPITQSTRFDPQGLFIKKYCPELASLSPKQIHDPTASMGALLLQSLDYPELMVDISKSRLRALEYFKAL